MQTLHSQAELEEKLGKGIALVFVHTDDCGICKADQPRIEEIVNRLSIAAYEMDPAKMPIARGQWSLFTVPVVLLFWEGKEVHRQARIIDFRELEHRILQLKGANKE